MENLEGRQRDQAEVDDKALNPKTEAAPHSTCAGAMMLPSACYWAKQANTQREQVCIWTALSAVENAAAHVVTLP